MLEAITETTPRAPMSAAAAPSAGVDRSGSADFDDAMAGALRPPEGGCQCEARASMASRTPAAAPIAASPPAEARSRLVSGSDAFSVPASVDRSASASDEVVEIGSCHECGEPFSLDDVAESTVRAAVATAPNLIGITTGWTVAGPARTTRPAAFET